MIQVKITKEVNKRIRMNDTKIGDLFIIHNIQETYDGHIGLRYYDGVIDLTDIRITWYTDSEVNDNIDQIALPNDIYVTLLPVGTQLTIDIY